MRNLILFITALCLLVPVSATATQNGASSATVGGYMVHTITLPSMATNAIDTTVVAISPVQLQDADGTFAHIINVMFTGDTGTGGSGTVDSMQVSINYGNDKANWVASKSLANGLVTNASPAVLDTLVNGAGPYLQFAIKNTGAATGTGTVTISYKKGD